MLVARTTPSGAEVLVDGKVVGKTPLERSDIRAGERKVALRHPYYEAVAERGRRFDDGRVVQIERRLVRGRGALTVTTDPMGAWVEIGGARLAERTPINMKQMPAGEVRLTLGAPGYRPLSVTVEISKGGLAQLERRLERLPDGPPGDVEGTRRRAEQGHASAQYNLALKYANGRWVRQDDSEAVGWYRKSAEQGHAVAQNNLGAMYESGRGVRQDDAEAVRWFRKAAEQGYAAVRKYLKRLKR